MVQTVDLSRMLCRLHDGYCEQGEGSGRSIAINSSLKNVTPLHKDSSRVWIVLEGDGGSG